MKLFIEGSELLPGDFIKTWITKFKNRHKMDMFVIAVSGKVTSRLSQVSRIDALVLVGVVGGAGTVEAQTFFSDEHVEVVRP